MRIAVIALGLFVACSSSETTSAPPPPSPVKTAKDPEAARKLIAAGAVIIDVRTADEFADDHLANATNVPVQQLAARMNEVAKLVGDDKTRPIVVYCAAGSRARKAKAMLDGAGYSHVVNGGGLDDLR